MSPISKTPHQEPNSKSKKQTRVRQTADAAVIDHHNTKHTPTNTRNTPTMYSRQYTPRIRGQFNPSTPPISRSTPCPRSFTNSTLLPPYIPPFTTAQNLEAERLDLLAALQREDYQSTWALGTVCWINTQLDSPIPLPPHQVKDLRRNLRVQRGRANQCMRKERWILQRLGEIAFQIHQIHRWERIMWHMAMVSGDSAAPHWQSAPAAPNLQVYGPPADSAYAASNDATYSPLSGDLRSPVPPLTLAPYICSKGMQPWQFDNTSGVTSAATTRRNTMIFPPNTPLNSRQGSMAAHGQGIAGVDPGTRLAQLGTSTSESYLPNKAPGRDAMYRRSEPELLVGHWESNGMEYMRYAEENLHSTLAEPTNELAIQN